MQNTMKRTMTENNLWRSTEHIGGELITLCLVLQVSLLVLVQVTAIERKFQSWSTGNFTRDAVLNSKAKRQSGWCVKNMTL